ncbi:MAG: ABC transporter substrate-binding protein [Alphaproteobacteria bacterium]|nr:ABC transporter substrate-binding protein [Alphaproteobacteria bacterium]
MTEPPMRPSTIGVLVALLAWGFDIGASAAADKVGLGTDWRAQAEHGGFYQAIANGHYARRGIEVTLRQGGPQINHAQLMAAGRLDFSMAPNSFIPLNFAALDIPAVAIAAIFQKDPAVLIAHAGVGNDSLEALKGKKIMISPDTRIGFWRFLKSKYGYGDEQVAPYTFNLAPFLADKLAIQQGYLSSEPFQIEKTGEKPNVFLLADAGYASYAALIMTSRRLMEDKPDLVQRFVDASILGWVDYLTGDPSKADALIRKDNPEMTDELLAYGRAKMKQYGIVASGDAASRGIGAMSDDRWKAFFEAMAADGLYKSELDVGKAYTLDFVNKGVGLAGP